MREIRCRNCGAPIHWNPFENKIVCPYCKFEHSAKDLFVFDDQDDQESQEKQSVKYDQEAKPETRIYKCSVCNSEVMTNQKLISRVCPYCGAVLVETDLSDEPWVPDYCIPFEFDKEQAKIYLNEWIENQPALPMNQIHINYDDMQGYYLPYYLYTHEEEGIAEFQSKTNHDIQSTLILKRGVDKYPSPASLHIDKRIIFEVGHYSGRYVPYNPKYLFGFTTDLCLDPNFKFKDQCNTQIKNTIKRMAFHKLYKLKEIRPIKDEVRTALMPLWVVPFTYNDKMYLFYINGDIAHVATTLPLKSKSMHTALWSSFIILLFFSLLRILLSLIFALLA